MSTVLRSLAGRLPIVCLMGALLGGCISTGDSPMAFDSGEDLSPGEVVVFGKFTVLDDDGDEIDLGSPLHVSAGIVGYRKQHMLFVADCARQHGYRYYLKDDGSFIWHLPPGNYEIFAYRYANGMMTWTQRTRATFTVPSGDHPVYIGEYRRPEFGACGSHCVRNQLSAAAARLAEQFPESCGKPKVCLMRIQPVPQ